MGLFRRQKSTEPTFQDRLAAIEPGVPGRCPRCDGFGYLDHVDLVEHFQLQHCPDCGHKWEYHFDADGHVLELAEPRTGAPSGTRLDADAIEGAVPHHHGILHVDDDVEDADVDGDAVTVAAELPSELDEEPVIDLTDAEPESIDATTAQEPASGPEPESAGDWLRRTIRS